MTNIVILGDGPLGRAVAAAAEERGHEARVHGRPRRRGRHSAARFSGAEVVVEASRGDAVHRNLEDALAAGCRRFVLATTAWDADRAEVERVLRYVDAAAVVAPNLSLGAALFLRLLDRAAELFGATGDFDPYVVEWHRREKRDRPSGTAREIVRRLTAGGAFGRRAEPEVAVVRAGSSPGMHLVGFDARGETVELRLTARDRSAYAAGALAAVDWLVAERRAPGIHAFDAVIDGLLAGPALAATA